MGKHTAPDARAEEPTVEEPTVERPVLRIVKGNPTPEELAALTVVIAAAAQSDGEEETPSAVGGWGDPGTRLRVPLRPGNGAWRSSGW